jgi:exopolysaccharide biosynthesis polyprenyl glycosylphosphotransferase
MTALSIAYVLRTQYDPRPLKNSVYATQYLVSFLAIVPVWIIVFASLGLYGSSTYNRRLIEWGKVAFGSFIGILLIIGWEYISGRHFFPARLVAAYSLLGTFILIVLERELMRYFRGLMFRYGRGINRVLLIGSSASTSDIAISLYDTKKSGYEIVSMAGPKSVVPKYLNVIHYSNIKQALNNIHNNKINTIIQTNLYDDEELNHSVLNAAQEHHIRYSFIPSQSEFYSGKNTIDIFLGYPMISVYQTPLIGWGAIAKRIFDTILSLIFIIIFSPLFILLFILQKIFNPGPIFYISKRLSRFSEPINLIKFRSMDPKYGKRDASVEFHEMGRDDLAEEYKANRKVENDPRITKFGAFLRKTSIDELPQLFNVLKGDLSLVGPRPILPQEMKIAKGKAALLHSVKSGITGLWQVSGRSDLTFDERIQLETFYAQNWSFWLDIKILFKTIAVVFKRRGAK